MVGILHELSQQRLIGEDGGVVGALFYFYLSETTDLADIYSDQELTEPLANPVEVAAGEVLPVIYLDPSITYRRRIEYTDGTVTDLDPLESGTSFTLDKPGAVSTSLFDRAQSEVYVSDFPTLQLALNSGAGKVKVDVDVTVTEDVTLASNQVLEFTQGKIIVPSGATFTNSVLYKSGGSNITIVNLQIDASATASGVPGLLVLNCINTKVWGGKLVKTNVRLESSDNTVRSGTVVSGLEVNLNTYASTGVYCSGINGAFLHGMRVYGGLEGFGLYNNARAISHVQCYSHSHTGDAFVIIAAQEVSYTDCYGYSTGQSGFTTQRQTSGANTRVVSYTNCFSWGHLFDGFDIRGANSTPWDVDTRFSLVNCHAWDNTFVGFYIVNAEGSIVVGCTAFQNGLQGFNIDNSDNVLLSACRSISNATDAPTGITKAGIYIANSLSVHVVGCKSSNTEGAPQEYGVSFGGTCSNSTVTDGEYLNNTVLSHSFVAGVAMVGAQFNKEAGSAVTLLEISVNGTKRGECFGIPKTSFALTWPNGSKCTRIDGGSPEAYITSGSNIWASYDLTIVP